MATNRTIEDSNDARLNELYWYTERTIQEIVRELSLSRNALYASIRPLPSGLSCARCGGQVVFSNRTSRDSGAGFCEACGIETIVPTESPGHDEAATPEPATSEGQIGPGERPWDRWLDELVAVPRERAVLIGGAAALGALLGTVAVRAARR